MPRHINSCCITDNLIKRLGKHLINKNFLFLWMPSHPRSLESHLPIICYILTNTSGGCSRSQSITAIRYLPSACSIPANTADSFPKFLEKHIPLIQESSSLIFSILSPCMVFRPIVYKYQLIGYLLPAQNISYHLGSFLNHLFFVITIEEQLTISYPFYL